MLQPMLIAAKEFGDRFRSGWVIACVVVWLGAIGLTSFLGLLQVGQIGVQGYNRTVISLLNLVQYLVPLLGLLLGHDLIVGEKEERTLSLMLAGGVSRTRFLIGKFLGGCFTLAVPLLLGFIIAGTVIGLAAKDAGIAPFLRLAVSGLILGTIFLGVGLAISVLCRTRVQSLVAALLVWCFAVFVFDLIALGFFVSTKAPAAAQEIEFVCEATHVNSAVDLHADFNNVADTPTRPKKVSQAAALGWLAINPIDLFRAVNLSNRLEFRVPASTTLCAVTFWFAGALGLSIWKLRRTDL
jgi:Cu-processing system permease protein